MPPRGVPAPDAVFAFTRTMVVIDNLRSQARIVCAVVVDDDLSEPALREAWQAAQRDLRAVAKHLRGVEAAAAADAALRPLQPERGRRPPLAGARGHAST